MRLLCDGNSKVLWIYHALVNLTFSRVLKLFEGKHRAPEREYCYKVKNDDNEANKALSNLNLILAEVNTARGTLGYHSILPVLWSRVWQWALLSGQDIARVLEYERTRLLALALRVELSVGLVFSSLSEPVVVAIRRIERKSTFSSSDELSSFVTVNFDFFR